MNLTDKVKDLKKKNKAKQIQGLNALIDLVVLIRSERGDLKEILGKDNSKPIVEAIGKIEKTFQGLKPPDYHKLVNSIEHIKISPQVHVNVQYLESVEKLLKELKQQQQADDPIDVKELIKLLKKPENAIAVRLTKKDAAEFYNAIQTVFAGGGGGGGGVDIVQYKEGTISTEFKGTMMMGEKPGDAAFPLQINAAGQLQVDVAALAGPVAVTQSGVWNITNITGTITLPTGAATSAKQLPDGHAVTIDNIAGNAVYVQPGTGATFAVTQSGTWNINNISGTISLPTGAATSAKQLADGHNVAVVSPTDFGGGPVTVGTSAVEVTFTGTTIAVSIQSDPDNTGKIYIGKSNVTNAGAFAMKVLLPGQGFDFDYNDGTNAIYVVSDTAAQKVFKFATK